MMVRFMTLVMALISLIAFWGCGSSSGGSEVVTFAEGPRFSVQGAVVLPEMGAPSPNRTLDSALASEHLYDARN